MIAFFLSCMMHIGPSTTVEPSDGVKVECVESEYGTTYVRFSGPTRHLGVAFSTHWDKENVWGWAPEQKSIMRARIGVGGNGSFTVPVYWGSSLAPVAHAIETLQKRNVKVSW